MRSTWKDNDDKDHKKKSGRKSKTQENISILSFSAICIAASLFRATASKCDAHNEN
jgi:hypothetical protein